MIENSEKKEKHLSNTLPAINEHRRLAQFIKLVSAVLCETNVITDKLQCFAYGGDASFYRLTPKVVLRIENLEQLQKIMVLAKQFSLPITFRAAGTSLSGQAITDAILIILSAHWNELSITNKGELITLKPDVIGAKANRALAPYQRKIGPDPASINSCKIGGIAANNASGMCCGVKDNSYHTLAAIKLLFADGSILDTRDQESCQQYLRTHASQIQQLQALITEIKSSPSLVDKIRHKYRLKNTTGYGLNALIDFDDIIDVISHLMIGSEGTLAFIAEITYHTLIIKPFKMTGLYVFDDLHIACQLLESLAAHQVDAVEIMDMRAIYSVKTELNQLITVNYTGANIGALLIEFSGDDQTQLQHKKQQIEDIIKSQQAHIVASKAFTDERKTIEQLWNIRKGMFPAVGAEREKGTTVIIEDVAFPLVVLSEGVRQLQQLFSQFGYHDAIIFGHALAGNLHFVFSQSFNSETEIMRYKAFMQSVTRLVAIDYQGSLKAEHGTGRNMAPFVELEWGETLYQVMKKIKNIFDPDNILNPDVIISNDPNIHLKHLKTLPATDDIIDKCIECGFCEVVCPSKNFTLTPRQRIALWRRIQTLTSKAQAGLSDEEQQELRQLKNDYQFYGIDSCAATGLCGQACPIGIDTSVFIKNLRHKKRADQNIRYQAAKKIATHFALSSKAMRFGLSFTYQAKKLLGKGAVYHSFAVLNKLTQGKIPKWYAAWPQGAKTLQPKLENKRQSKNKVIYIPSCANRIFAADNNADDKRPLPEVFKSVLAKAGIDLVIPDNINEHCCGMPWFSKGFNDIGQQKRNDYINMVIKLSEQGQWPVVTDASPCALTLNENNQGRAITIYEASHYIAEFVLPYLTISPKNDTIMLHKSCSSLKMDQGQYLEKIARACCQHIIIAEDITCCGFAGDKGFYMPALNKSALAPLKKQIPAMCSRGISNSRSCEIGLSEHSQMSYQSFLYLLDQVSQ